MKVILQMVIFALISTRLFAQGFEIPGLQDTYHCVVGEAAKASIRLKNTADKATTIIVKRESMQIGSTQKNYFCLDANCQDMKADDITVKLEPGQTLNSLHVILEGGLAAGESSIKYMAYNKANPAEFIEFELNFVVEEKPVKQSLYNSAQITLHDVYPNPVSNYAFVDYKILNDRYKVRIVLHNVLGNKINDYDLPSSENIIKIRTEDLSSGIYFYTLYVNNESVLTRKLIVRN